MIRLQYNIHDKTAIIIAYAQLNKFATGNQKQLSVVEGEKEDLLSYRNQKRMETWSSGS